MNSRCRLRSAALAASYGAAAAAAAAATLAIGAAGATVAAIGAMRHCNVALGATAAGACCAFNRKLFQAGVQRGSHVLESFEAGGGAQLLCLYFNSLQFCISPDFIGSQLQSQQLPFQLQIFLVLQIWRDRASELQRGQVKNDSVPSNEHI